MTTITITSNLDAAAVRAWFAQRGLDGTNHGDDTVMLDATVDPEFGLPVTSVTVTD